MIGRATAYDTIRLYREPYSYVGPSRCRVRCTMPYEGLRNGDVRTVVGHQRKASRSVDCVSLSACWLTAAAPRGARCGGCLLRLCPPLLNSIKVLRYGGCATISSTYNLLRLSPRCHALAWAALPGTNTPGRSVVRAQGPGRESPELRGGGQREQKRRCLLRYRAIAPAAVVGSFGALAAIWQPLRVGRMGGLPDSRHGAGAVGQR
jgi:hypothetical protein